MPSASRWRRRIRARRPAGEFDVEHRGRDLRVAHQLLQGGQGHPRPYHIRAKGVTKPMGVGVTDSTPHSMMAEQRTEASCSHGLATLATFERNKQNGRVGQRPLQAQIVSEYFEDFRWQRDDAFLISFARDAHLAVGELHVFQFQCQDLTGAQAVEEHQPDQCEITIGAEALPKLGDFLGRKRHDDSPFLFEPEPPRQWRGGADRSRAGSVWYSGAGNGLGREPPVQSESDNSTAPCPGDDLQFAVWAWDPARVQNEHSPPA